MDGDGSTGGHADGAGGFADGAGGFADGAGGIEDVAATAAAVASAAQPLPPSLVPNAAATRLRVVRSPAAAGGAVAPPVRTPPVVLDVVPVWRGHAGHRSGGGHAVCHRPRRTMCVLCPQRDFWRRTAAIAVWLGLRRRR